MLVVAVVVVVVVTKPGWGVGITVTYVTVSQTPTPVRETPLRLLSACAVRFTKAGLTTLNVYIGVVNE